MSEHTKRKERNTLELCAEAAEIIKKIGFEFRTVSRENTTCYYGWPGREELLRISDHGSKYVMMGLKDKIAARITFSSDGHKPGFSNISDYAFEHRIAEAIGWYFMRTAGIVPMPRSSTSNNPYDPNYQRDSSIG